MAGVRVHPGPRCSLAPRNTVASLFAPYCKLYLAWYRITSNDSPLNQSRFSALLIHNVSSPQLVAGACVSWPQIKCFSGDDLMKQQQQRQRQRQRQRQQQQLTVQLTDAASKIVAETMRFTADFMSVCHPNNTVRAESKRSHHSFKFPNNVGDVG